MLDSTYISPADFTRYRQLHAQARELGYFLDKDGEGCETFRLTRFGNPGGEILYATDDLDAVEDWLS